MTVPRFSKRTNRVSGPPDHAARTSRMKRYGWMLALALAGCTAQDGGELAVSGQIEGISVDAGSKLGGRVAEVRAREGERVAKGDVLVKLESVEAEAQLAAAEAQLAQTEALVAKVEHGARPEEIRRAEAAVQQAEEQYAMAQRGARAQEKQSARAAVDAARARRDQALADYRRAEQLYADNAASQQVFDQARHAYEAAKAQYEVAEEQLDMVVEGTREEQVRMAGAALEQARAFLEELRAGVRDEDKAAARAVRDAAAAAARLAEHQVREMTITAPFDGVVEALDVYPGDLVKPGPLVRITDPDTLEVVVYVSASALAYLDDGERVSLTTDSHGDRTFEGEIVRVATQGEYTPRNLQTQEERVQQMFGVKIRLSSADGALKAGMTATAHFDLDTGTP